jgi:hypothetical protein
MNSNEPDGVERRSPFDQFELPPSLCSRFMPDATRPFPGRLSGRLRQKGRKRFTVYGSYRQGFLTPGSNASHPLGLPRMDRVASGWQKRMRNESPVHSGGNRAGFTPDFPLNLRRPAPREGPEQR